MRDYKLNALFYCVLATYMGVTYESLKCVDLEPMINDECHFV